MYSNVIKYNQVARFFGKTGFVSWVSLDIEVFVETIVLLIIYP